MRRAKIETILPDNLIREIQKYIQGEYIYIPYEVKQRKKWGEHSGSRADIQARNEKIRGKYECGFKVNDLAKEFFLSVDSIKKIIYVRNK